MPHHGFGVRRREEAESYQRIGNRFGWVFGLGVILTPAAIILIVYYFWG